jgi:hypothetical protein
MKPLALAVLLVAVLAVPGCKKHARQTEPEPEPPPGGVTAAALHKAYHDDLTAATQKYGGKEIAVAGYVQEKVKDPSTSLYYVGLVTKDGDTTLVRCYFGETWSGEAKGLKGGSFIVIRGVPGGFQNDMVRLQSCQLGEKK